MSTGRTGLLGAGLALALVMPAMAQPPAGQPPSQPEPSIGVERALGMRAQLGLSAQQIAKLETLRKAQLETRQTRMSEMLDLRSRFEAGDLTQDQFRAEMQSRRESMRGRAPEAAAGARDVLTEAQQAKFRTLGREAMGERRSMAFRGGSFRRGGRGAAAFGRRGFGRRGFGGGFGPGRAPGFRRGSGGWGMGPGRLRGRGPDGGEAQGRMWRRGPDAGQPAPRFNRVRPRPDSTGARLPEDGQ